jgi:hypothetical protein
MEWTFPVYNFTEKQDVTFRVKNIFSEDYLPAFQEFIHYYAPDVVAPFANSFPKLKPRRERVCRFCKKIILRFHLKWMHIFYRIFLEINI